MVLLRKNVLVSDGTRTVRDRITYAVVGRSILLSADESTNLEGDPRRKTIQIVEDITEVGLSRLVEKPRSKTVVKRIPPSARRLLRRVVDSWPRKGLKAVT